ncbi:MAG TPA: hypothetical protein VEL31_26420 [Ktedonobacteraceae bacterium]|nr:hypothetical protein [Ktedonobacteraceae bacterium]
MAKRFIRWILPLLVVMTIAMAFAITTLSQAHAASPTTKPSYTTPAQSTPAGLTPDAYWHG